MSAPDVTIQNLRISGSFSYPALPFCPAWCSGKVTMSHLTLTVNKRLQLGIRHAPNVG